MTYDILTPEYRQTQIARILKVLQRLGEVETQPGRVVPEAEDLVIGEGRRLRAAVLFLDISGFSSWPAETANEQKRVLALLNLFFTEMVRIAEDYGGTVEKNTGDGLMAYFEDRSGSSPDEGSKRAVASALTMLDTNNSLITPILTAAGLSRISFRVAIDHGFLTIGRLGAAERFNAIVAVGTAANVASKMLSFAQPDEIVIGDTVQFRLPQYW
jgi:class 3 adenylate cyclase